MYVVDGRLCFHRCISVHGVHGGDRVPPPSCPPKQDGCVPALSLDRTGYPHPMRTKGVSPPHPTLGVHPLDKTVDRTWDRTKEPPPRTGPGTTLGTGPVTGPEDPPTGCDAGGTPLAVTQEDFLVQHVPTKP